MTRARLSFLLRALLSVGLISLLLTRVHWTQLAGLLRGAHPAPAAAAAALSLTGILLMSARTNLMLRQWGIALAYRTVLALTWLGQFCNAFLPGATGGDVVKFYRVCRHAPQAKAAAVAALVADRLVALAALMLLAAAALAMGDRGAFAQVLQGATLPGAAGRWWVGGGVLSLLALVLMAVGTWWLWRGGHFARVHRWWQPIRAQIGAGLRGGPFVAAALVLAVVVHLTSITGYYLFARALEVPMSFGQVMLVWPVVMVVTLLPLTVNGYGLRECVTLYYFQHWHLVSGLLPGAGIQDTVIALSLLSVFNDFFWSLPGGFCLSSKADSSSRNAHGATSCVTDVPRR